MSNLANLEFDALNYEALSAIVKITDFATYYKESENSEQNDMFYWQMLKSLHALLGSFSKPLYHDSVERIEEKYITATLGELPKPPKKYVSPFEWIKQEDNDN